MSASVLQGKWGRYAFCAVVVELAELCRVSIEECDALYACVSLHLRMLVRYVCE